MKWLFASAAALPLICGTVQAFSQETETEVRARETEQQMTDDERFSMLISLLGPATDIGMPRDPRIPAHVANTSAGYTPGVPRLGIPPLQSSDASMGVTNPAIARTTRAPPRSPR